MMRLHSLVLLAPILAACSGAGSEAPPHQTEPIAVPPSWTDAPGTLSVREGTAKVIPLTVATRHPEKLVVEITAADSVEAEVVMGATPDARSLRIRADYAALDGATVHVRLDDGEGGPVTIDVPLAIARLSWVARTEWKTAEGPQPREHGAFFFDETARAAYLLQGSGYHPQWVPIEDSWKLDLTDPSKPSWSSWTPTGDVPPPGAARRVASVPGTRVSYLYGGYTGSGDTEASEGDLHRVDLGNPAHTFTKLTSINAPVARQLHYFAYDAKGEQLVVFGGFTEIPSQRALADTWLVKIVGDTATWTEVTTKPKPSPRYGGFYAMDTAGHRFVVWSGGQMPRGADMVNAAQDAWALDLEASPPTWSALEIAGTAPPGRRNGCGIADASDRLFVFGGTSDGATSQPGLFALDLTPGHERWAALSEGSGPPPRSSGFGFADAQTSTVYCGFGNDKPAFMDLNVLGYPRE